MMPKADTIELDMTVDAALKYIVSMGVVAPAELPRKNGSALRPAAPASPAGRASNEETVETTDP
jgi:Uncharacterized conserved protein